MGGAFLQHHVSKPFVLNFSENDWTPSDDGFILSVPAQHHMRRQEIISTVYQITDGVSEVVMCDEQERQDGSFVISAGGRFNGRLVLK